MSKSNVSRKGSKKVSETQIPVPTVSGVLESNSKDGQSLNSDASPLVQDDNGRPSTRTPDAITNEQLLRSNINQVTSARQRLGLLRREKFYFLTIPGLIRIVEVFFSLLHVTMYGFYYTFYEKDLDFMVSPFFIATTREQLFLITNFHSFMGGMTMVVSGIFSSKSNTALISSLYPFVFDLIQFIMIASASISLILLYKTKEIKEKMPVGLNAKWATSFTGAFLACFHLISSLYDLVVFIRRWRMVPEDQEEINS